MTVAEECRVIGPILRKPWVTAEKGRSASIVSRSPGAQLPVQE